MGKKNLLQILFIFSLLLLSACGNEKETSSAAKDHDKLKKEATSTNKDTDKKAEKKTESSEDNGVLNPNIAKETEGNVEVIYQNKDPKYTHDMDGFKVSVDEYEITKVTDMNESSKILFDDQLDGYIITTKVTLENGTSKPVYYPNYQRIQLSNNYDTIQSDFRNFVPEDQQINMIKKNKDDFSLFEAGEKVTGLMTFTLTNDEFNRLKQVKPKYIIEGGAADNEEFKNGYVENSPAYDFIISDEQAKTVVSQPQFYQDRLTSDNWADKKMIFEKSNIHQTQQIDKVKITLEGVQYTDVIPTEANKEMFKDFGENGIAALTVKVRIDNQTSSPVSISNVRTVLKVDDNRATYLSQGMAEPNQALEVAAGKQIEKLSVFLFRKDEFQLYKKFTLVYGPFISPNGEEAFKGRSAAFTLPR